MSTGGTQNVGGISASMEIDLAGFDAQLAEARQKLDEVRVKLTALDQAMRAGTVGPKQYAQALAALQAEEQAVLASAGQLMAALQSQQQAAMAAAAASQQFARSTQGVKQGSGEAAMGLMILSQFIDDAQYGFKSIVNNMPQVGYAFGKMFGMSNESAMKLGGALGITAVAINTWINNWESAKELMADLGWLDTLTAKLEDLKTSLTDPSMEHSWLANLAGQGLVAVEVAGQTQKAKAQAKADEADRKAAVEAIGKLRTPEAEATGRAIRETVVNLPGGPQSLLDQLAAQNTAATATPEQRALTRGQTARMIRDAIAGDVASQQGLFATAGPEFQQAYAPHAPAAKEAAEAARKAEAQAQKDEDDFIAADQRESARRVAEDRRKRQQAAAQQQRAETADVQERARQLAGGELGLRALSQAPVTEADVRQRLGQAGLTPQQVEAQAGPVFQGFAQMMRDQIQGRAIAEGTDLNTARAELLSERIARANDDPSKLRQAEDPEDLMRQLLRLRLDAMPEQRAAQFVQPAQFHDLVQQAALQGEDRSLRALLDIADRAAEQTKLLEKISGGVPAVTV